MFGRALYIILKKQILVVLQIEINLYV